MSNRFFNKQDEVSSSYVSRTDKMKLVNRLLLHDIKSTGILSHEGSLQKITFKF